MKYKNMENLLIFTLYLLLSFFKCSVILKVLPTDMVDMGTDQLNLTLPSFFEVAKLNTNLINLNTTASSHLSYRGYGAFINISYSTVFLKLSIDQSLIYLSLYNEKNNQNNNQNISQYKFSFYNVNDENCWLYVNDSMEYCTSNFHFKYNDMTTHGYLGHDFGFFEQRFVMLQNLVYLMQGISNFTNENKNNVHGILGLGYSDNEGVYGNSLIEELVDRGIVYKYKYGLCLNNVDSFLIIGDDNAVQGKLAKIQWFDQYNSFNFMVKVDLIQIKDRTLNKDLVNAHINLDSAIIYLPELIVEPIIRNIVNNLCYISRDESNLFYKLKEKVCNAIKDLFYGNKVAITLSELNIVLNFLPDLTISLYEESFKKSFIKNITNYFKVCPSENASELLEQISNNSNPVNICSLIQINLKNQNEIELGTFFLENLYTSFDLQNGRMGFANVKECASLQQNSLETDVNFWIEILYNLVIFIGIFLLILISVNKCDKYFHDDYEIVIEEEEEEEEVRDQTESD